MSTSPSHTPYYVPIIISESSRHISYFCVHIPVSHLWFPCPLHHFLSYLSVHIIIPYLIISYLLFFSPIHITISYLLISIFTLPSHLSHNHWYIITLTVHINMSYFFLSKSQSASLSSHLLFQFVHLYLFSVHISLS